MEKICKDCRYFHKLKELVDGEWVVKSCCTLHPESGGGYNSFALVVAENDYCEDFSEGGADNRRYVYEAYKLVQNYMCGTKENEPYVVETVLGYLGQALGSYSDYPVDRSENGVRCTNCGSNIDEYYNVNYCPHCGAKLNWKV